MIDYSLYLVTDRGLANGRSTVDIVMSAIKGGVSCVQLREKSCPTREFISEARALKEVLAIHAIPLIINDRIDVALAVQADGIHLGQSDMHINDARRIAEGRLIIGISAESVDDAIRAEQDGADYIGISPVFMTSTKNDIAVPHGLPGVAAIRAAVSIPLVGIGGINHSNAAQVISAGADGVAVVSAIISAKNPEKAARELRDEIRRVRH